PLIALLLVIVIWYFVVLRPHQFNILLWAVVYVPWAAAMMLRTFAWKSAYAAKADLPVPDIWSNLHALAFDGVVYVLLPLLMLILVRYFRWHRLGALKGRLLLTYEA